MPAVLVGLSLALLVAGGALLPRALEGVRLADAGSEIVGRTGARRYLVLAQNPAELRPVGGYTGTVGVVGFADLRPTEREFVDVYEYDLREGVPYVEPPEALANHLLGAQSWQLADAAWSPDFPTSAQNALRLYELESGDHDIDGVIALNTYAIDRLLELTGRVEVPGYSGSVGPGEVTLVAMRETRGISVPGSERKAYLNDLAHVMLARLETLPAAEWARFPKVFGEMIADRSVLAWFKDPAAQDFARSMAMDGAVRNDPGDYLYVVEANVGPSSKYNLVVDRADSLTVRLDSSGTAHSQLDMDWTSLADQPGEPYASLRSYSTSSAGLYGTYVRVLTPSASVLDRAEGLGLDPIVDADEIGAEAGRNVFGNYVLVPPGQAEMHYAWTTRSIATQSADVWTYRLVVQRQPGLRPMPLAVTLELPAGAIVESSPPGTMLENGALTWRTTLEKDLDVMVSYSL